MSSLKTLAYRRTHTQRDRHESEHRGHPFKLLENVNYHQGSTQYTMHNIWNVIEGRNKLAASTSTIKVLYNGRSSIHSCLEEEKKQTMLTSIVEGQTI